MCYHSGFLNQLLLTAKFFQHMLHNFFLTKTYVTHCRVKFIIYIYVCIRVCVPTRAKEGLNYTSETFWAILHH